MTALRMLGTDVRVLLVTTSLVWWRLLPRIVAIYLLGYLGYELAFSLAAVTGQLSAWLALVIFSTGFLAKLMAIVLVLRLVGQELAVKELLPADESDDDDRDASVSRLLAVTLLPFLGIYTAFGFVNDASQQLLIQSTIVSGGVLGASDSILGKLRLNNASGSKVLLVTGIIVAVYLLRRGLDKVHEHTGWRALGILTAFVEGFFVLATLTAGADIIARAQSWLGDRQLAAWLSVVGDRIAAGYHAVVALLPSGLVVVVEAIRQKFWPVLLDEVTQPVIWLAVAALVYGSRVISVAELWRRGRPLVSRQDRVRVEEVRHRSSRARTMGLEFREAFLGDIDDKYLPTIHSLRLVVRAGFVFLGAYILVYALQAALTNYWQQAANAVVGGHDITFWTTWNPVLSLVTDGPLETWRLCLLGAAFFRCLQIFRARSQQRAELADSLSSEPRLEPAGVGR